jgi:hypothetical protein
MSFQICPDGKRPSKFLLSFELMFINRWLEKLIKIKGVMKTFIKLLFVIKLSILSILFTFTLGLAANNKIPSCHGFRAINRPPVEFKNIKNPIPNIKSNILKGEKLYQKKARIIPCAQCHGKTGKGDGPMAWGFTPSPTNFVCRGHISKIIDGRFFWTIKKGSHGTGMLPYKSLKDEEIWEIILYIRHLAE